MRFPVLPAAILLCALTALPAAAQTAAPQPLPPSGAYLLDLNHASVTFKINHLGFSHFTGRFDKLEGSLNLNADDPSQSALDVTIYPNSVDTNNVKLEEELRDDKWFNVIKYPRATFHATRIERTGPTTAKITGDFTLMGQTHTVVLDTTLVGEGIHMMTKKQVAGFSATATIKRSDYGLTNLLPMVGDDVKLEIEAEFDKD